MRFSFRGPSSSAAFVLALLPARTQVHSTTWQRAALVAAGLTVALAAFGCGGTLDSEPSSDAPPGTPSDSGDTGADACATCVDSGHDSDATTPIPDAPGDAYAGPWPVELCDDGLDNDGNGQTDCLDRSCFQECNCGLRELCTNGADDDCDGLVDCDDPYCARDRCCTKPDPTPIPEKCTNGVDDDCDGVVDCADPDCASTGCCAGSAQPEACDNGIDDDCDGVVDCMDSDCPPGGCPCTDPSECWLPPGPCESRTCEEKMCSTTPFVGWLIWNLSACWMEACEESGEVKSSPADTYPTAECESWYCVDGAHFGGTTDAGRPCGDGLACNGMGACAGCADASTCPPGDECRTPTCFLGICGFATVPDGYAINYQKPGDCRLKVCSKGSVTEVVDDSDTPDDGLECTWDVCTSGNASQQARPAGAPCSEGGGTSCDGAGNCT